jgi:hypothetical protein
LGNPHRRWLFLRPIAVCIRDAFRLIATNGVEQSGEDTTRKDR